MTGRELDTKCVFSFFCSLSLIHFSLVCTFGGFRNNACRSSFKAVVKIILYTWKLKRSNSTSVPRCRTSLKSVRPFSDCYMPPDRRKNSSVLERLHSNTAVRTQRSHWADTHSVAYWNIEHSFFKLYSRSGVMLNTFRAAENSTPVIDWLTP
jgi:hypothetical protein